MSLKKLLLYALVFSLTIYMSMLALIPSTDDFAVDNPLWNGLSILASRYRLKPIRAVDASILPPGSILLVIGPSYDFTDTEVSSMLEFVEKGGRLIVMDDYGSSRMLLDKLGVSVKFLEGVLRDPLFRYRASVFPKVRTVDGTEFVFNYGTALKVGEGVCYAWSSMFSYLDTDNDATPDPNEPKGPLCVLAIVRRGLGTIIVVSDSSVLLNAMLWAGLNKSFMERILGPSREVYIVSDKWRVGLYTVTRNVVISFIVMVINSSYRYPLALYIAIIAFVIAKKVSERLKARIYRLSVDDIVRDLLSKHPEWDPVSVRKVVEEVLSSGEG